jgi:hypothetical protein
MSDERKEFQIIRRWMEALFKRASEVLPKEGDGGWRVVGAQVSLAHKNGSFAFIVDNDPESGIELRPESVSERAASAEKVWRAREEFLKTSVEKDTQ